MVLFAASVRVWGEIMIYFKCTKKNPEKYNRGFCAIVTRPRPTAGPLGFPFVLRKLVLKSEQRR